MCFPQQLTRQRKISPPPPTLPRWWCKERDSVLCLLSRYYIFLKQGTYLKVYCDVGAGIVLQVEMWRWIVLQLLWRWIALQVEICR